MAARHGFRAALWAKLGMLFLQAAEYSETKRKQALPLISPVEQETAETEEAPVPLKGAPPHWLAMVRERAPGFLNRLETLSYQSQPVIGEISGSAQSAAVAGHSPVSGAAKFSMPELKARPQERSEPGITGALEPSERSGSSAEAVRDDSKPRLRFKAPEIGASGQVTDKAQQARRFDPAVQTPEYKEAKQRARLNFKSEQQAVVFKPFQHASAEAPPVKKREASPIAPKIGAATTKVLFQQDRLTEKTSKTRPASAVESSPKPGRDAFSSHEVQQPALGRANQSDVGSDMSAVRADRKEAGQAAHIQNQTQTRNRPGQSPQAANGNESVSADSFWPDLSGLGQPPMKREHWPELPEDAWNDFWRQDAAANIKPEPAEAPTTEALWNG